MINIRVKYYITYIFFLTPFLPPFESPLFLPTAMSVLQDSGQKDCRRKGERLQQLPTDESVPYNSTGSGMVAYFRP